MCFFFNGYAGTFASRNPDDTDRYNMDHKRRGLAVIINNVKFKGKAERFGSDVDYAELKRALVFLGFDIETYKDQTVSQMLRIFKSGKFTCILITGITVMRF